MEWMLCTVSKGLLCLQGLTGAVWVLGRREGGGRGTELHRKGPGLGFGIWGEFRVSAHQSVWGFLGGSVIQNPPANKGDTGSVLESGRSPGEGNGNPHQYSCLGNPMDRGAWGHSPWGYTNLAMTELPYALEDREVSDKRKRREVGFGEKRKGGRKGVCSEGEGNSFEV